MASLMAARFTSLAVRRCIFLTNARTMARAPIPTDFEHATGIDKREQELKLTDPDPFKLQVQTPVTLTTGSTRDDPNLIPSVYTKRIVGCICEEDQTFIRWMWLYKGESQRCDCGRWFKLVAVEPIMGH